MVHRSRFVGPVNHRWNKSHRLTAGGLRAAGALLCAVGVAGIATAQPHDPMLEANPAQSKTLAERQPLVVGATTDSFPYGFVDKDGQWQGFCVDLLDATARAMNLQLKRVEAPSRVLHQRFRAGEFDVLQDYSEAPD